MKVRNSSQHTVLSCTLCDGETNKYVKVQMFDQNGAIVQLNGQPSQNLTHISGGTYMNNSVGATVLAVGFYIAKYTVYSDSGYTTLDVKYGTLEEDIWITNFETAIVTNVLAQALLANDARLNNLNTIPNLATTSQLNTQATNIINNVNSNTDNSDGRAV